MRVARDNWELDVSNKWTVMQHPECLTLELADRGALQLSSATKRSGRVDYAELQRVAGRLNDGWGSAEAVVYKDFSGLLFSYIDTEGIVWKRWFLGHESILLFVTYNADMPISTADEQLIVSTLETLRVSTKTGEFPLVRRGVAALRRLISGSGLSSR